MLCRLQKRSTRRADSANAECARTRERWYGLCAKAPDPPLPMSSRFLAGAEVEVDETQHTVALAPVRSRGADAAMHVVG